MTDEEIVLALQKCDQIVNKKRSDRTLSDYQRAFKHLNGQTPQEYRHAFGESGRPISSSRYRVLKGAYQLSIARQVVESIRAGQALLDQEDSDGAAAYFDFAESKYAALQRQEPDYDRQRYRTNQPSAHPSSPMEVNRTKNSKRRLLAKLKNQPDWQSRLIAELPGQHKMPTAVLALTGCRPSELEKGVIIEATEDELIFTIKGSKVTSVSGQRKRIVTLDPTKNKIAGELHEAIYHEVKSRKIRVDLGVTQRSFFESHVRAASRTFGKRLGKKLSPYVHRQSFSATLKAEGYSREEIAMAMGHATDRTQVHYGMAQQSGGNSQGLKKVEASRKIKSTRPAAEYFTGLKSDPKN